MSSYNRVVLMGNVTRDFEVKYLNGGTAVAELGMAVNERVKKNDQWTDEPVYVDVTLFGKTAETANTYLHKGSPVMIEGRLKLDQWEDKKTGDKRSKLKVVADRMVLLGGKKEEQTDMFSQAVPAASPSASPDDAPW